MEVLKIASILAWLSLLIAILYGYVMNIINLIDGTYHATSTIVIGALGVIIPFIGALVHFIGGWYGTILHYSSKANVR